MSKIKEKIDLKSKKIQLSNISITLSNLITENGRLSDRLTNPLGENIDLYIKTQSCETIYDCNRIAKLKITRYNHDNTSIRINADDISLETFYLDLPTADNVLIKDENTFEKYDLKPIPILFGELESAPAIPYVMNMAEDYYQDNNIFIYFDTSANTGLGDVEGIKNFNLSTKDYIDGNGVQQHFDINSETNLINSDSLKILVGDSICSVNCLPYVNASNTIRDYHFYPQYDTQIDRINLITNHGTSWSYVYGELNILRKNALWVHDVAEVPYVEGIDYTPPPQDDTIVNITVSEAYTLHRFNQDVSSFVGNNPPHYSWYAPGSYYSSQDLGYPRVKVWGSVFIPAPGDEMVDPTYNPDIGVNYFAVGVQKFNFSPISSADLLSDVGADGDDFTYPTDLSIVANLDYRLHNTSGGATYPSHKNFIWGYPSGFTFDAERIMTSDPFEHWNWDGQDGNNPHFGFPPELGTVFNTISLNNLPTIREENAKHNVV